MIVYLNNMGSDFEKFYDNKNLKFQRLTALEIEVEDYERD